MKKIFSILFILFTLQFAVQLINACDISETPLRKRFRTANSVFVGEVLNIDKEYEATEEEKLSIPEYWRNFHVLDKVTFKIEKKWKENLPKRQEFLAVAFSICGCSYKISQFEEGKRYLVFSEGKSFVSICSSEEVDSDAAKRETKRIDNFWFRIWSRIYPF